MTQDTSHRVFLLSPARTSGLRAQLVMSGKATFDLAQRVRDGGASVGEIFSFLSGLYFRGKLAYALKFERPYGQVPATWVITSDRGLIPHDTIITMEDLQSFSEVEIDPSESRYVQALEQSAIKLRDELPANAGVVLLGSIGTNKYAELLIRIFGSSLLFPSGFVGRGDMSRGGLLLRQVDACTELEYIPVAGATRHGKRPPKLPPKPRS